MAGRTTTIGSNTYTSTQLVLNVMGMIFRNNLVCSKPSNTRRGLQKTFSGDTPVGETFQIRNPQRKVGYAGRKPVSEPTESPTVSLIIDNQRGIQHEYIAWEDRFFRLKEAVSEIAPEMNAMTSKMDLSATAGNVSPAADTSDGGTTYLDATDSTVSSTGADVGVYAFGEAGKDFGDGASEQDPLEVFSEAGARFKELGVNITTNVFLPPMMNAKCATAFKDTYNPQGRITDFFNNARIEGTKPTFGLDSFSITANMKRHTVGALTGVGASGLQVHATPVADFTSITLKGLTANARNVLRKGDVLGFRHGTADIAAVNFSTREAAAARFECTVQADVHADSSGRVQPTVFPPFAAGTDTAAKSGTASVRNKRMTRLPAANDLVYVNGKLIDDAAAATAIGGKVLDTGYIYTPSAIVMMWARQRMPKSTEDAYAAEVPNEFFARVVKYYNAELDMWKCKTDSVWGVQNVRPEESGKVFGRAVT